MNRIPHISDMTAGELAHLLKNLQISRHTPGPFVLPFWIEAWDRHLNRTKRPLMLKICSNNEILGVAPLSITPYKTATFMGSESVCDFQDIILFSQKAVLFFETLLAHLKERGVERLSLGALEKDSITMKVLPSVCKDLQYDTHSESVAVVSDLELPETWEGYLTLLNAKQRHEVRRKLRRLSEAGQIDFHIVTAPKEAGKAIDIFLSLFKASRPDKARFLSVQMADFFKTLTKNLADQDMLRLGVLKINHEPAAAVFCFEYNSTLYLYNNGYNPDWKAFSVGLLSKINMIRFAVKNKIRRFSFLKGDESYKKHLGGQCHSLYRLTVLLNKG